MTPLKENLINMTSFPVLVGTQHSRDSVDVGKSISQTNTVVNQQTTKMTTYGTEIDSLKKTVTTANQTLQTHSQNHQNHSNQIATCNQQISALQQTAQQLTQVNQTHSQKINACENQVNGINQTIANLNKQVAEGNLARIQFEKDTNALFKEVTVDLNKEKGSLQLQENNLKDLKAQMGLTKDEVVRIEKNSAKAQEGVNHLQNKLIPELQNKVQQQELKLADGSRFEKLELQSKHFEDALEKEKKEHENTKNSLIDLNMTVIKLQEQFQAFQETTKAKEKEHEGIIEELKAKIAKQQDTIIELSAAAKKAHRLSGEFSRLSEEFMNKPEENRRRSAEFEKRKEDKKIEKLSQKSGKKNFKK